MQPWSADVVLESRHFELNTNIRLILRLIPTFCGIYYAIDVEKP